MKIIFDTIDTTITRNFFQGSLKLMVNSFNYIARVWEPNIESTLITFEYEEGVIKKTKNINFNLNNDILLLNISDMNLSFVLKYLTNWLDKFFKEQSKTKVFFADITNKKEYWEDERTGEKLQGAHYKEYIKGEPIIPVTKPYFNDWVGSLEIGLVKGDKVVPIGYLSGLADEIKANVEKYKGAPIEITCMEIQYHEDGRQPGLRHAKFVRFRPDLTIKECSYEKVFSED